ncbi:MAG: 16S rRNA (guanine(527)-N(7))-methyltransferase RsmG [Coriobacteriaceae bacterium]|nr:16S rRNA (guanine(527)-N(7))-methyltransferase RsmG [Coriobacteriaceae bacterium]
MSVPSRPIELIPLDDQNLLDRDVSQLQCLCRDLSFEVPEAELRTCVEHLMYVLQVNEYINLTSITDLEDALVLHVLDSLTLLPYISSECECALDMGSGPGFPGVPLAVCTPLSWSLLDSVGKKMRVVEAICKRLGISSVQTHHDRIESFGKQFKQQFELVVARALAPLPILLEYARPLLKQDGCLLVSKGAPSDEEMASADAVSRMLGYKLEIDESFDLPNEYGHRNILRYRVVRPSQVKLPRAMGLARKQPLA